MYGLILTYLFATAAVIGSLRFPLFGLFVYVGFAVLRPQSIWGWAGDLTGLSYWIGVSMLLGWAFRGFGSWRFGRGRGVVVALMLFVAWFILSGTQAIVPSLSFDSLNDLSKMVLPVLMGMTLLDNETHRRRMLWTIVLCQGYVGWEMNLHYLRGLNIASSGFGGMDNNCFGASLVSVVGPAVALAIASKTWYERLAAWTATALILHTILLTFSRGAFVGLVAVGITAFVMMPKRPKYMFGVFVAVALAVRLTGPELAERYSTIFADATTRDASAESRIDLWRDCLVVIQQSPILGVGPANWGIVVAQYGWPGGKSAHSVWMETAAETGIPGALLLFSFFAIAALKLWPMARARHTGANNYDVALAAGVVLSIVGFGVAGQFVSVPGLEVPYYIVMVGVAMLKNQPRRAPAPVEAPKPIPPFQPIQPRFRQLPT